MQVYHATSNEIIAQIKAHGFRDATGTYLTRHEYSGVWISDRPMDDGDAIMGSKMDRYFEIIIPEEVITEYEWIEEGKPFREWLVPAAVLNQYPRQLRDYVEDE